MRGVRLRLEEVVLLRRSRLRLALNRRQQAEERGIWGRGPLADRRLREILLEVEELQLAGRPDDFRSLRRVVDAGELDDDLVAALDGDARGRDAELVDAAHHDVLSRLHLGRIDR